MSKPIKSMIMRDYTSRMNTEAGPVAEAALISIRGLKGKDTTKARAVLHKKNIRVTVVRNSLARKAFEGSKLAPLSDLFSGPSALAYGGQSVVEVARELVELAKTMPAIELKGAILDGIVFKGKAGVEELSKFPTKDEAIGQVVTLVISPARKLLGQIAGPASTVAGLVKAIETKLEKGETIAAVG